MTKPIKSEQMILNEILKVLKENHFFAWRNNSGSFVRNYYCQRESRMKQTYFKAGVKGMPDILAVRDAQFYAIEVKTKTGRTSPEQKQTIADLKAHGAIAFIARSLDDIQIIL